jgi:NAD(P)H-dependent FMN reductase
MQIGLIVGSHRPNSQSSRVGHYLASRVPALDASFSVDTIDLAGNPLPLWDESTGKPDGELAKLWKPYAERLQKSEGFIVVSPEWHGMVPAGLKNFFLYANRDVAHKPALIVGVSATRGGAYPVEELRMSSYKNSRILYIPEHLIVRDAASMFAGDAPSGKDDEYLRKRADFALTGLIGYTKALKPLRDSGILTSKEFLNGM